MRSVVPSHGVRIPLVVAGLTLLAALLSTWLVQRIGDGMREELLQSARLVTQALEANQVDSLSFTSSDEALPEFQNLNRRMKELVSSLRLSWVSSHNCVSIYSLKQRDNTLYFGPESIPPNDPAASPPGTPYLNPPPELLDVFTTCEPITVSPFTDEYGTFVSAFVPLLPSQPGRPPTVIGLDVQVHDWKWSLAARAAMPIGLIWAMWVLCMIGLAVHSQSSAHTRPVMGHLLLPLAAVLSLMLLGAGGLLLKLYRTFLNDQVLSGETTMNDEIQADLDRQASGITMALQVIASSTSLRNDLKEKNVQHLQADWQPVFEQMKQADHLTHFLFYDTRRICLLRLHRPAIHGDTIDRFTALQAERTGETTSGLEIGKFGTLVLRVVQPIYQDGTVVGYVELGKDLPDIFHEMQRRMAGEWAVLLHKTSIDRHQWTESMQMANASVDWDRLPHSVLISTSQAPLPEAFNPVLDHDPVRGHLDRANQEIEVHGKFWRVASKPLADASGTSVGCLLIMTDISMAKASFHQLLFVSGISSGVVLMALLGFVWVLLRRTDKGILARETELRESEHKHRILFADSPDAYFILSDGRMVDCNRETERILKGTREQLVGLAPSDFSPEFQPNGVPSAELAQANMKKALQTGHLQFLWTHRRMDGQEFFAEIILTPSSIKGRQVLFASMRDRTEEHVLEENYHTLFNQMLDGFAQHEIICDAQGRPVNYRFLAVNPAFERITGLKASDILGKTVLEVMPTTEAYWIEVYGQVALTGKPIFLENYSHALSKWFQVTAFRPVAKQFACIFSDVTERKRATNQIRFNLDFQKMVSEISARFLAATTDTLGVVFDDMLSRIGSLFGVDRCTVIQFSCHGSIMNQTHEWCAPGAPSHKHRLQDYPTQNAPWWMGQLNLGKPIHIPRVSEMPEEASVERAEFMAQSIQSLLSLPMATEKGELIGLLVLDSVRKAYTWPDEQIAMLQVVTGIATAAMNRTRALEALARESEERRILLDNIQTQVWYLTDDHTYGGVNQAHASFFGVRKEDLANKNLFEVMPADVAEISRLSNIEVFRTGKTVRAEEWIDNGKGKLHLFSLQKTPKLRPDGSVEYVVVSAEDITERKYAEEALAESNEQVRMLAQQVPGVVFQYQLFPDGHDEFPFASDHIWDLYEVKPEEIRHDGSKAHSRAHPEDYERVRASLLSSGENLSPWQCEFRVVLPTRGTRWLRGVADPIPQPDKSVLWNGYISDITEVKQAEIELALSQEQFALAVWGSNDGIWDWNITTNELFLSAKWKEQLGYRDDEVPNEYASFESRIHPDDKPFLQEKVQRYLAGLDQKYDLEFRLLHKDGTYRWIRSRGEAVRNDNGAAIRMAGSHTDITESKHVADEMQRLGRQLREVIDLVPAYIFAKDMEGRFLMVNWAMAEVFHLSPEEVVGKTESQLGTPENLIVEYGKTELKVIESGAPLLVPNERIRKKDGSLGWFQTMKMPYSHPGCEKPAILCVATDITERKNTENALLDANIEMEEAMARANQMAMQAEVANVAKSDFLANMSHEIRTPMNGVIGMTSLLLDTPLNEDQRRYAEIIRSSGDSLLTLLNDILDYSKIEAGKLAVEITDLDLEKTLQEVIDTMGARAKSKDIALACKLEPQVPTLLRGDPARLRQILNNLVGNAIKFTAQGSITIRVSNVPIPPAAHQNPSSTLLRFSVKDTGIGIPQDKQDLLFNKFSQVDPSTTRKYGGTGLGLAICKQLVELMNGSIGVISSAGVGSDFWFCIPFEVQIQKNNHATRHPPSPDGTKNTNCFGGREIRILLAEDNEVNQLVAQGMFGKCGLRADVVGNGKMALEALSSKPYDIIFMDIQMPVMDGIETTRKIRSGKASGPSPDHPVSRIPIVALTAHAMQGDRQRFLDAGMDDYITKPLNIDAIRTTLERWLNPKANKTAMASSPPPIQSHPEVVEPPVFDKEGMMQRLMDDLPLAKMICESFCQDIPQQIELLKQQLIEGDIATATRQIHSIKGASANVGGEALRALAIEMEHLGHKGDLEALGARMDFFLGEANRLIQELGKFVSA